MSLISLVNIFFHQRLVPLSSRPRSRQNFSTSIAVTSDTSEHQEWKEETQQPLLDSQTDISSQSLSDAKDLESQRCIRLDSSGECEGKRFRINARLISDATLGLSDGLTVPFALTAGLSAMGNTNVVIYGGLAELMAGAISMGLGGYLGATSEVASYRAQRQETENLLAAHPELIMQDVADVFKPYGIPGQTIHDLSKHLANSPHLIDFLMQFKHCEEEPPASRALISALTIALSYFLGGMLPLIPYFFVSQVRQGLYISIGLMIVALFTFGYLKTGIIDGWHGERNIRSCWYGGTQMVVVGGVAAAAAMGLVKLFQHS